MRNFQGRWGGHGVSASAVTLERFGKSPGSEFWIDVVGSAVVRILKDRSHKEAEASIAGEQAWRSNLQGRDTMLAFVFMPAEQLIFISTG